MTTPYDDVLTRARAALQNSPTTPKFKVLPDPVPIPEPRQRYRSGHSRDADKFVVRFPDDMRVRLARVASLNQRSSNSEIVAAMDWWMEKQALMWSMLQATERELTRLEHLRKGDVQTVLDDIAEHHPQAESAIKALKALIREN